jgi:hypothetical protein
MYKASTNQEGLPNVVGPGNGFGYYAHTLNVHLTCETTKEAVRTAAIANIAYDEGYKKAQYDIRISIGIEK